LRKNMTANGLIDTGVIVAVVDRKDPWHASCVEAVREFRPPLLTSVAVLAEVFHLLCRDRVDIEVTWDFLGSGIVAIGPITDADLPHLHSLMSKYGDQPMDFADATLVHLARRESIDTILTLDRDFEAYRIEGRKRFNILPAGGLR
jgi:uncharacterized protein